MHCTPTVRCVSTLHKVEGSNPLPPSAAGLCIAHQLFAVSRHYIRSRVRIPSPFCSGPMGCTPTVRCVSTLHKVEGSNPLPPSAAGLWVAHQLFAVSRHCIRSRVRIPSPLLQWSYALHTNCSLCLDTA